MKENILILISLLLTGVWSAQAQIIQQQYIEGEVHSLIVNNHNTVTVMPGNQNMIRVKESHVEGGNAVSISNGVIKVSEDGFSRVDLIVKPGTFSSVEASEFGSVTISLLALSDNAVLRSREHGSLTASSVTRKNDDRYGVSVASADTPKQFTNLRLEVSEFGSLTVKHPVSCSLCNIIASEHGAIDLVELNGNTAKIYADEFGSVEVGGGTMDTVRVKYSSFGSVDVGGIKMKYNTVESAGTDVVTENEDIVVPFAENCKPDYRRIYDFSDRYSVAFYFGWSMWGEAPYSSMVAMDGAWDSKLKFTNFGFEANYAVMRHFDWMFQVGFGFTVDAVKLRNNYVFINEQSNGDGVLTIGDNTSIASYGDMTGDLINPYLWQTHVTAGYLTVPLRFARTNRDNDYSIGISLVPGVTYVRNVQHIIANEKVNGRSIEHRSIEQAKHYLNPVKLDLRLDATWNDALGFYVQTGLLPMTRNLDDDAHYFSFGFKIGF